MKRECIGCKSVLAFNWNYDKCSSCFKASGEWSDDEYWDHMAEFGLMLDYCGYSFMPTTSSSRSKSKSKMFKPPVWY